MASNAEFDEDAARRDYGAPYSHNHPIPTVQRYREHRDEEQQRNAAEEAQHTEEDDSRVRRAFNSVKAIVKDEDKKNPPGNPYPTTNLHTNGDDHNPGNRGSDAALVPAANELEAQDKDHGDQKRSTDQDGADTGGNRDRSATEKAVGHADPRQKRKDMKHNKRDGGRREVTDPVTHLPLIIRDSTSKDLRRVPDNEPAIGTKTKTATGLSGTSKSSSQLELEHEDLQKDYDGMQRVFPPPAFDDAKAELVRTYQLAFTLGAGIIILLAITIILLLIIVTSRSEDDSASFSTLWNGGLERQPNRIFVPLSLAALVASGIGILAVTTVRGWLGKKVEGIWEDEVWDAARAEELQLTKSNGRLPESVAWMNSLLASVWPLINPDLFASVVDELEDVMQASLPKVIRMVSVDDLGQGSEAIRILGIRWLPGGAASSSVDEEGNLKPASNKETNDRAAPGEGEEEDYEDKVKNEDDPELSKEKAQQKREKEQEQQAIREGMEAEQGDFVNMEVAFAYRARSSGKSLKAKAKNAHLYLRFYLPGGIYVPVWVELRGIIGTMRLRLQLTPDPPFFSLCTMTFLGQPRADLSCVPLSKHLPNLMDVPLISSFVQSSIDAALAEYVAPKSLTLNIKDMLIGDDFKKDTITRGVLLIFIKEAQGFKEGDGGIGPMEGSSDAYVTCSWGKFGKTISSTRIIAKDQRPKWHEWAYLLVTPEELNAEEKLRLQLWDSDRYTADDDLGRVEVDLKELVFGSKTKNQMFDREDRLKGQDPDEKMPGTLSWSVGYYSKTRISEGQLSNQADDEGVKSEADLKKQISVTAERKLREATSHDESKEINQQKEQDYKEREDALMCASPPDPEYPSGILSVQIHNITGLEVESLQKRDKDDSGEREDAAEHSDDLPSSYCTIILNHKNVYMTRTKPKNARPFFNAGTERYIRDWKIAEVMISVRDSRERENDALLGVIYLPLSKVFEKRSQVMDTYPIGGGVGFGRARISMVFRSIELQMPKELLGWDLGTLEIKSPVRPSATLSDDLFHHRIKLRSNMGRVKMVSEDGGWHLKNDKTASGFLACRKRYAMPLVVEFRHSSLGPDSTPAFAIFWLHDLPDEEEKVITLKVWKGGKENLKRATTCAAYEGLADGEQPLGEIEVTLKFWRGLSGYHKSYARKGRNGDMRNVMEVLDTVNDEIEGDSDNDIDINESDSSSDSSDQESRTTSKKLKTHTNQDSASEDSDASGTRNPIHKLQTKAQDLVEGHNDSDDGSRGPMAQFKDYKDHRKQLHRKNRGIMQWKVARSGDWALDKVRHGKSRVGDIFEHQEKTTGIETEV